MTDFVLSGSDAEKVTVAAAIDGETRCGREIPARYRQNRLIWLGLTIGLTVAALICLIACVRLSKRLKKERLKLLDTVSRQSNRTIRDNRD